MTFRSIALITCLAATPAWAQQPPPSAAAGTQPGGYLPPTTVNVPAAPTAMDIPAMLQELTRAKTRLDDWPQLSRYAAENASVTPAAANDARVVFLGDSITDAWDSPKFGGFFPGKPYVNRGISGQTTPQMVLRMRADVLAHKPKALVLLAGTNDIASNTGPMTVEQIEDNIATIAELATLHGIKVVLASILPISNYHNKNDDPRGPQTVRRPLDKIRALNAWMKTYASEHGHVYLDYWTATADAQGMLKAEISEDDLHPNAAGYALMAPLVEAAIAKALALPAAKQDTKGAAR